MAFGHGHEHEMVLRELAAAGGEPVVLISESRFIGWWPGARWVPRHPPGGHGRGAVRRVNTGYRATLAPTQLTWNGV